MINISSVRLALFFQNGIRICSPKNLKTQQRLIVNECKAIIVILDCISEEEIKLPLKLDCESSCIIFTEQDNEENKFVSRFYRLALTVHS